MSEVGNVTNNAAVTEAMSKNASQKTNNEKQQTKKSEEKEKEAEYSGSVKKHNTGAYNKNGVKVDLDAINSVKAENKNNAAAFKAMVEGAKKNNTHSLNPKDSNYWGDWVHKQLGKQYTVDEAKKLVADDGYWGVEQTSQRIVDFAKALSGGDAKNYDKLLSAIKKGFGAAKDTWGGKMPSITSQTYDAVMEKMEAWKEELNKPKSQDTQDTQNTTDTQKAQNAQ